MLNIRIDGVEEALRSIGRFEFQKIGRVSFITEATAFRVHAGARSTVRVDTGYLKNSIVVHMPDLLTADVGVDTQRTAHYAPFVERRFPFLIPSWEVEQGRYMSDVREAIRQ
jgi:hypothetical protein